MKNILNDHWAYKALFYTRVIWVVVHLVLLGYEYEGDKLGLYKILLFCLFAGIIPQFIWFKTMGKKTWVYPVIELVLSGAFLIYSSHMIDVYFSYIAIPAMCAAANIHSVRVRIPLWIWFSVIPAIAMAIVLPISSFTISIIEGFLFFGLGYIIWKVIDTQWRMQQLLLENEQQRQVLEQYAKQVEVVTLLEERNRLSRELHDTVGHTLTSVIMGLDAVSYLIKEEPEEAINNINQLRKVSRKGLEEIRNQIHHIAPPDEGGTLSTQLKQIASEFSLNTGTQIQFEMVGKDTRVSQTISLTLIRCLQESLTNAKRHGGASLIEIRFMIEQEQLILTIEDNGRGMKNTEFGFGLTAMRERIESYQGELTIDSSENGGTTVTCQLPLKTRKAG
ncbi:sensor histidine kinase [Cytobacillus suaedae]|nr:sensor histidine kinase [Cytobacillus suaedae]